MGTIVSLIRLPDDQIARIQEVAKGWEIVQRTQDSTLWKERLKDAEILIAWSRVAAEEVLGPDSKLRWLQNWGAGVDQLPLEAFAKHGVKITNASGVHAYPISENILAMMMMFARKLHTAVRYQGRKEWGSFGQLNEIHGRTVGIIGVGAIGEETARLAKAFGMKVLGVRLSGQPTPNVDRMFDLTGLHEVLQQSDYVVNTLPSTERTRHMFGRAEFQAMKLTAYYLNIGRGATTDTEALIEALREGSIAGAGLDVFEQEPLPAESPLWEMDNVIMTPHNAGSNVEYDARAMDIFLQNLQDYLNGREPSVNRVDFAKQY
ncbi:D-2-hydroxyacid dehydrogenase [Cohnella pontilimi]|uniref:D-2-hydroxyacid dehydrogenase n=1 Tax=Cohnella pontilimi TaxID=2564100 RepID=A0A4V5LRZ4_9BACL|nr:D-2-hydroxyacid dehydrogenase [Cohnella pontilimi]TJY41099.1 D-2-hydroxyacid dehydrogenase [Cohnella pontilimi]